jgi:hypothetical protein
MLLVLVFSTLKCVFNFLIDYTNSCGLCQEGYGKFCKILTKIRQCIDREQAFTHMRERLLSGGFTATSIGVARGSVRFLPCASSTQYR